MRGEEERAGRWLPRPWLPSLLRALDRGPGAAAACLPPPLCAPAQRKAGFPLMKDLSRRWTASARAPWSPVAETNTSPNTSFTAMALDLISLGHSSPPHIFNLGAAEPLLVSQCKVGFGAQTPEPSGTL
ncbi:hypothetical protein JRQ81_011185 [Phrynocephalus forsythii]|uniref:Uncharacterized protein n=1 Tax=Phrynocephalus forsythii TaxID=171643 RepID=A0A9Q1AR30_9SAUR|nr:hypothetical protein JRQ81_011185 [Phrynocephalus forsythii]